MYDSMSRRIIIVGLRSLQIEFADDVDLLDEYAMPGYIFLSKLTGILALRRLGSSGVLVAINVWHTPTFGEQHILLFRNVFQSS